MTTTMTQDAPGELLAQAMQIKPGYAERLADEVDKFNSDAIEHGNALDQTFADLDSAIDEAETLKFTDFQKKAKAVASTRLRLLQERLQMFHRRQKLLFDIDDEISDRIQACWESMESIRSMIEAGLRQAGRGPEDRKLWKKGHKNLANIEFTKEVESTDSFIDAQKAWRHAQERHRNLHHQNQWTSEAKLKADLRNFVAEMSGAFQLQ